MSATAATPTTPYASCLLTGSTTRKRWATGLTGVIVDGLRDLVRRMDDFARQTERAGNAVLQLDVL